MMITGYFRPTLKKWYVYPLGICVTMTFGIFEITALNFNDAMQIYTPLLSSAKILTSWYTVCFLAFLVSLAIMALFDFVIHGKKQIKK